MAQTTEIKCPKCGSTQLTANKKGFSGSKAIVGGLLTGGIGLFAGFHGSNKIQITCLSCGETFKPGQGNSYQEVKLDFSTLPKSTTTIKKEIKSEPLKLNQKVKCSNCDAHNEMHFKFCRVCGGKIDVSKMETVKDGQSFNYIKCPVCFKLTPTVSRKCKYCINCGELISEQNDASI